MSPSISPNSTPISLPQVEHPSPSPRVTIQKIKLSRERRIAFRDLKSQGASGLFRSSVFISKMVILEKDWEGELYLDGLLYQNDGVFGIQFPNSIPEERLHVASVVRALL